MALERKAQHNRAFRFERKLFHLRARYRRMGWLYSLANLNFLLRTTRPKLEYVPVKRHALRYQVLCAFRPDFFTRTENGARRLRTNLDLGAYRRHSRKYFRIFDYGLAISSNSFPQLTAAL